MPKLTAFIVSVLAVLILAGCLQPTPASLPTVTPDIPATVAAQVKIEIANLPRPRPNRP